jgi:hypothetical protein
VGNVRPIHFELSLFVRGKPMFERFRHFDDMEGYMVSGFRAGVPWVFVRVYWAA